MRPPATNQAGPSSSQTKQYHYQLLDSGNLRRYEKLGPYYLIRPAPMARWSPQLTKNEWAAHFEFHGRSIGAKGGKWVPYVPQIDPEQIVVPIQTQGVTMLAQPTQYGHIGFFPEHHTNPGLQASLQHAAALGKEYKLLNLFAYTGALSLIAARSGAAVTHVDRSKKSVAWAKQNAKASGLEQAHIRYIVDGVKQFVSREVKRGTVYQGIVLDPPSYGIGIRGERWTIHTDLEPLLQQLVPLLDPECFYLGLSCHTEGIEAVDLAEMLGRHSKSLRLRRVWRMPLSIPHAAKNVPLVCGAGSALIHNDAVRFLDVQSQSEVVGWVPSTWFASK